VPEAAVPTGREDSGADDCSNPDERYTESCKRAFESKLWTANAGQNFIKVLGVKNSSKQGVASGIGISITLIAVGKLAEFGMEAEFL
jgi:hypothetical protein